MLIAKITDEDIIGGNATYLDHVDRYGARGILFDESRRIALLYMAQNGYYKLPGGGVEANETPKEAFIREVKEETGCLVEIVKELGVIEEHKGQNNFLHVSYCYIARKIANKGELALTDNEKKLGFQLVWMTYDAALEKIQNDFTSSNDYGKRFMLLREKMILESGRIFEQL